MRIVIVITGALITEVRRQRTVKFYFFPTVCSRDATRALGMAAPRSPAASSAKH
jgi:hypothetical protein